MVRSSVQPSYRALLAVPMMGRVLAAMQLGRIAQGMVSLAIILFTLSRYHSPALAGWVGFASIAPGIVVSPVAGALLDRHGRTRLVMLDYLVAAASVVLIAVLARANMLDAWLLLLIAAASSLTNPLSGSGLRSLFPLLVPRELWERVNAVDSNGWVVATIVGPPIAGTMVGLWGGEVALSVIGAVFVAAALCMIGAPDPRTDTRSTGSLFRDAWQGLAYTLQHPTLRGLAVSLSVLNLAQGMINIVVPLLILDRLHLGDSVVGLVFAVTGLFGFVSAFAAGRVDTRGREWPMFIVPMVLYVGAVAILFAPLGLAAILASMALIGLVNGPMDIALFTMRQRRTDPALFGRAFAVSMSLNFSGVPIGSAITGSVAGISIELAIALGIVAAAAGAIAAAVMIPRQAEAALA